MVRATLILLFALASLPSLGWAGPQVVTSIGGVEVTTTLGSDELDANGSMNLTVSIRALETNPLPKTVRARLGMPGHGHWITEEETRAFNGEPLVFEGRYPMYGQYRFRVWMDFADGTNNTAIDFMVPGQPLEAVRVAPMPAADGKERTVVRAGPVELTLPDLLSGEPVSVESMRGQPLFLSFWASWCGPCRAELPEVDALKARWQGKGPTVLGVSLDKDPAAALRFLQSIDVDLPSLIDVQGDAIQAFDAVKLPLNVLIAADGTVVAREEGYRPDFLAHANTMIEEQIR
jgi:thiol-disulfide isomerase/thioredoxin